MEQGPTSEADPEILRFCGAQVNIYTEPFDSSPNLHALLL